MTRGRPLAEQTNGCDHPAVHDGTCAECDETCSCDTDSETAWPDVDGDCPIHGAS